MGHTNIPELFAIFVKGSQKEREKIVNLEKSDFDRRIAQKRTIVVT